MREDGQQAIEHQVTPGDVAYLSGVETDTRLIFMCPGCKEHHAPRVKGAGSWTWNGSFVTPTLEPSILVNQGRKSPNTPLCHSFLREGRIQFLDDCSHPMAGQTVPLQPLPHERS